jgi:hypothetical protein
MRVVGYRFTHDFNRPPLPDVEVGLIDDQVRWADNHQVVNWDNLVAAGYVTPIYGDTDG